MIALGISNKIKSQRWVGYFVSDKGTGVVLSTGYDVKWTSILTSYFLKMPHLFKSP